MHRTSLNYDQHRLLQPCRGNEANQHRISSISPEFIPVKLIEHTTQFRAHILNRAAPSAAKPTASLKWYTTHHSSRGDH